MTSILNNLYIYNCPYLLPPILPIPPTPQIHCFLFFIIIVIYIFINTNYWFYFVPLISYVFRADYLGLNYPEADWFFSSQWWLISVVLGGVGSYKNSPIQLGIIVFFYFPNHVFSNLSILTALRVSGESFKL